MPSFDSVAVRQEFPALFESTGSQSVVYLDSAATTQKPQAVIDCLQHFYTRATANVHRATHHLAITASQEYEAARKVVADFIGAKKEEIIFTSGTTESINLVAQSFAASILKAGDEIIVSEMEHHANIVPWQQIAEKTGAKIILWPMETPNCQLNLQQFERLLNNKTKLVAIAHTSNITGTRHSIEQVIAKAHQVGAKVVVDGAQAVLHEKINLNELNADFFAFSGHKLFAPSGIGVLFGKSALLNAMPPWKSGGKMVEKVSFVKTTFAPPPERFEAGTPNAAGAIALAKAIEWYQRIDHKKAEEHIQQLRTLLLDGLKEIEGIQLIGLQKNSSTVAFNIQGIHHSDLATLLDHQGIAVRTGQHCAHPFMDALSISGCVRISIALYNSQNDILRCINAIKKATELL